MDPLSMPALTINEAAQELRVSIRAMHNIVLRHPHYYSNGRRKQLTDTKNGTSRGVPLHRKVVDELRMTNRREGIVFRTDDGSEYTRPKEGQNVDTSAGARIRTAFKAACRRAGISDFHPHDCRHTWATWHYIANRDLGALMRLGGWKTMTMVMRYAHVNVDELAGTIDRL